MITVDPQWVWRGSKFPGRLRGQHALLAANLASLDQSFMHPFSFIAADSMLPFKRSLSPGALCFMQCKNLENQNWAGSTSWQPAVVCNTSRTMSHLHVFRADSVMKSTWSTDTIWYSIITRLMLWLWGFFPALAQLHWPHQINLWVSMPRILN